MQKKKELKKIFYEPSYPIFFRPLQEKNIYFKAQSMNSTSGRENQYFPQELIASLFFTIFALHANFLHVTTVNAISANPCDLIRHLKHTGKTVSLTHLCFNPYAAGG